MSVDMLGEEFPLCVQGIAGEVRRSGVLGTGQIEEKVKSAGFLILLRMRNTVEPLQEARQGGTFSGWGGRPGTGRKKRGRRNSSLRCRSGVLQGGGGGRPSVSSPLFLWSIPLIVAIVSMSELGDIDWKPVVCSLRSAKTVSFEHP